MMWSGFLAIAAIASLPRPWRVSPSLQYPLAQLPRVAVFRLPLAQSRQVRVFTAMEWRRMEGFRPQTLAGHYLELARTADLMRRGLLCLPELQFPLVVFSEPGRLMEDSQRDSLWRWFGLPVFEQVRDSEGLLIARSCEAASGFHVVHPAASRILGGHVVHTACNCGDATPRVLQRKGPRRAVAVARSAATAAG
jgi:hypothetical protein